MSRSLLSSKFFRPPPRRNRVQRLDLIDRLNQGWESGRAPALTLISAPAGFGKTTLLSSWVSCLDLPVAWLSLDKADGDLPRFLLYLCAALRQADPDCGSEAMAALASSSTPSSEVVLSDLINELDGLSRTILLVLDDYQDLNSPPVDEAMTFLIERLPSQLRLAIASREDPHLPLALLRSRDELRELRVMDLRFSEGEAAIFLSDTMGLHLERDGIAMLTEKTEGWISGLQFAALSLRDRKDWSLFISSFAGSNRFVLDYLVDEVLSHQSSEVQEFLLVTSVLDRLCGPLCDALMRASRPAWDSKGQGLLESAERENLFIIPLDDERRWYRYHRLFAELLRHRLESSTLADPAMLHHAASLWCESSGYPVDAFIYATRSGNTNRAERLAWARSMPVHFRYAVTPVLQWLGAFDVEAFRERPSLLVLRSAMSLIAGRTEGVADQLEMAERHLSSASLDLATRRTCAGRIAAIRATLAQSRYDAETILDQSGLALELLPPEDEEFRFTALWTRAYANVLLGERDLAKDLYGRSLTMALNGGNAFSIQIALFGVGESQERENRLCEAEDYYRRVLDRFSECPNPSTSEAHLGLARIYYEWNDLDGAEEQGERSLALSRQYDAAIDRWVLCEILLSRILLARDRASEAAARLASLAGLAQARGFSHRIPEIATERSLVYLSVGDLQSASSFADASGAAEPRARLLLAKGETGPATELLEAECCRLSRSGLLDTLLKTRLLLALALFEGGDASRAVELMGQVLTPAHQGRFTRMFLDLGPPMARLLQLVSQTSPSVPFDEGAALIQRLLPLFPPSDAIPRSGLSGAEDGGFRTAIAPGRAFDGQFLVEPLSARERDVLGLIAQGLSNREIGERLFIALDTVKGHNRRIFEKLAVKRRTEALVRARELGLIP